MNNEELQSRREFFKKAAKAALPMIAAVALAGIPTVGKATEATGCSSCGGGCRNGCTVSCGTNCAGRAAGYGPRSLCDTCKTACTGCTGGCGGCCKGTCFTSSM